MVTAGVYLIIRSHVIFEGAPDAALVVVIVGAVTLLFGAVIARGRRRRNLGKDCPQVPHP
jgi:NADH:ubiquinone oxidoreductase subunit 5 (subunit L)/multisubunit Na+/H+ antiporter MnhA subunit